MEFSIPEQRPLSDMEKLVYGLRELLLQCNIINYSYNEAYGILQMSFKDGSAIGTKALFRETGLFNLK